MTIRWRDVTIQLEEGMAVWPGDPELEYAAVSRIALGAEVNTSRVVMGTHTGTHIDAPWHYDDNGRKVHQLNPDVFFGKALLLDCSDAGEIALDMMDRQPLQRRVIFRTSNSEFPVGPDYYERYISLTEPVARRLVDEGVQLVGIDAPSVGPWGQEGDEVHRHLLRHNIVVVEGLRLAGLRTDTYDFVVLPLPLYNVDGAPCRAFIGIEEYSE